MIQPYIQCCSSEILKSLLPRHTVPSTAGRATSNTVLVDSPSGMVVPVLSPVTLHYCIP